MRFFSYEIFVDHMKFHMKNNVKRNVMVLAVAAGGKHSRAP